MAFQKDNEKDYPKGRSSPPRSWKDQKVTLPCEYISYFISIKRCLTVTVQRPMNSHLPLTHTFSGQFQTFSKVYFLLPHFYVNCLCLSSEVSPLRRQRPTSERERSSSCRNRRGFEGRNMTLITALVET